jgi:hypothetical protein
MAAHVYRSHNSDYVLNANNLTMSTQVNEPPTLPGLRNITILVLIHFQPYIPSPLISSQIVMKKTIYAFQQGAFHYKRVNILQLLEMISVCFVTSHRSTQIAVHTTT